MQYEHVVLEILKSLVISSKVPDYNRESHNTQIITQAFEMADEFVKMLKERAANRVTPPVK